MVFDGTLKFDTGIDDSGFEAGLSKLGTIAKAGMAAVAGAIKAGTEAVVQLGRSAITVGESFESSMAQVIATMGVTKDTVQDGVNSYELLKKAAADAGESTTFSASEAADALNYLALAGYSAVQAAEALPAVLDLAAAGGLDLKYAADLATDAMAALGIEASKDNLTHFGDQLAKTASRANASVAQLGEAILTVGGTAKELAGGTTELNAALGVLANRGIKGAEAGTHLRNMILSLETAQGGQLETLNRLGVSALDAEGKLRPLNEIFADLAAAGAKTQDLNDIFKLTDIASAQAMIAGCGEEFDNLTAEIDNCDDAMSDMAKTMKNTLEGDMQSLGSKAEALGIAVYEGLNDPLRGLAQLGGQYISQLTAAFKTGSFEGIAAAIGDVLGQALGKLTEYLPDLTKLAFSVVSALADGLKGNSRVIANSALALGKALLTGFVTVAVHMGETAVMLLASLANELTAHPDLLVNTASEIITQITDSLTSNLPVFVGAGIRIIQALAAALAEMIPLLAESLTESIPLIIDAGLQIILTLAQAILDGIPQIVSLLTALTGQIVDFLIAAAPMLMDAAVQLFMSIADALPEVIQAITKALPQIISAITKLIPQITSALIKALPQLVGIITKSLPVIIQALMQALPQIISAMIEGLLACSQELLDAAIQLFYALIEAIPVIMEMLLPLIPEIIVSIAETLAGAHQQLYDAAASLLSSIIEAFPKILLKIGEYCEKMLTLLLNWVGKIGSDAWRAIKDFLSDMVIRAKQAASDMVSGAMQFLDELPGKIGHMIGEAVGHIVQFALDVPQKAKDAASGFLDNAVEFFQKLPGTTKEWLDNTIDKVKQWASDLAQKGRVGAADLVKKIETEISALPQKMYDAGKHLVEGLWNGITGMGSWLKDKISGFAGGIIDGFKDSFGIESPSKVMRDSVGRYIAQGLGVGFTEEIPQIGQTALDAFSDLELPDIGISADINVPFVPVDEPTMPDITTVDAKIENPDLPEFTVPELMIQNIGIPEIEAPRIELPELETVEIRTPDIEFPEMELPHPVLPDLDAQQIELILPDIPELICGIPELPELTVRAPEIRQSAPEVDPAALRLLSAPQRDTMSFVQPSPTSEITNNYNTYNTTNTRAGQNPPVINVHVHVDAEMDGDKIAEKVAEKVDILQGETIVFDERGTVH